MNTKLIEKLRNGEVAIEFDNEEDGLLELSQVLKAAFPEDKNTGLTDHYRYYYKLTPKQWYCSTLHLPEGMTAYPLNDFLEDKSIEDEYLAKELSKYDNIKVVYNNKEEDKSKYSLKSVFDEARKVVAKENRKYHSKEYAELLERIKPKENKPENLPLGQEDIDITSDRIVKSFEEEKHPENKPGTTFTQLLAEELQSDDEFDVQLCLTLNPDVKKVQSAAEKYAELKMAELAEWLGNKKVHFDGSHWYFIADANQTTAELIKIFNAENNGR